MNSRGAFWYSGSDFYCEDVALADIAAVAGTPVYVYSQQEILTRFRAYDEALNGLPHLVCYAVKANSNQAVLGLLARAGAGFDIVSGGELYRVLQAGGDPARTVFSGVGKTAAEIEYAIEKGVHSFNCESEAELSLIDALAARRGARASFALRVNPDVDAATHPYISTGLSEHKFGIPIEVAEEVYARGEIFRHLDPIGVSCHIGSQILNPAPILEAVGKMLELVERLQSRSISIRDIDLGGGLGVAYRPEDREPEIRAFVAQLRPKLEHAGLNVLLEPGRSITGAAGVLLTRVLYRKQTGRKEFIVVDAAMNDLIRPALYESHHEIVPLRNTTLPPVLADVVGPVCESADFLARNRKIDNVMPGDYLAVCTAGAYAFVASSNYNSRLRPAEVLVEGDRWRIVRRRETYEDLVRGEVR